MVIERISPVPRAIATFENNRLERYFAAASPRIDKLSIVHKFEDFDAVRKSDPSWRLRGLESALRQIKCKNWKKNALVLSALSTKFLAGVVESIADNPDNVIDLSMSVNNGPQIMDRDFISFCFSNPVGDDMQVTIKANDSIKGKRFMLDRKYQQDLLVCFHFDFTTELQDLLVEAIETLEPGVLEHHKWLFRLEANAGLIIQ